MAMIYTESRFQADVVGDSGQAYGLMQIQPKWHYQRMLDLNCTNLLDPKQNVTVGIDLLAELLESGKGIEWALSAYNAGIASANKNGCNDYAELVMAKAGEF
jgi:soluble lytic murein transglycosylase-like protein